jgi:hypothetical protein
MIRLRCHPKTKNLAFLALWLCAFWWCAPALAGDAGTPTASVFPPPLQIYQDTHLQSLGAVLKHRISVQPLNLLASLLFLCAVFHTFFAHKFQHWAHVLEQRAAAKAELGARSNPKPPLATLLHFLGEVEVIFGIWVIPLALLITLSLGAETASQYLNHHVNFREPIFVVVIMAMASTRPVLELSERGLRSVSRLFGGGTVAWWWSILTLAPLLGSLITEPAAMTIAASLLAKQFYARQPRSAFAYATLGLLFVNISIGGTLTHFAAPPVLMVAAPWKWGTVHMLTHFGWKAALAILASNALYFALFRKDFRQLQADASPALRSGSGLSPIPAWVTLGNLLFMGAAVLFAHSPASLIGTFLFFLGFTEVTQEHQAELQLRPAILVGFFLAGLVVHGGLQQWWIGPVLGRLGEIPLLFGSIGLTAFNDNAAITYLATLVPGLSDGMKYAVVAGAVTGGGLTVIANAPNPAGQAILGRFFPEGIAPLRLFLGALPATVITTLLFLLFRG